jgi:uncharacterized protein YbaP (TraB family)
MNLKRNISMILTAITALLIVVLGIPAHAEPALWMIKGPHSTVYLFGSVHVLQKDRPWRSPKIDAAIKKSDALWLEVTDADDAKAMQPLIAELGVDMAHPLSTKLTKDQVAALDAVAKKAGVPGGESAMEPLRPWTAALTISMAPMMQAGYDPSSGVEQVLKPEFTGPGKSLHGLETASQQFHFFADLPEKQEVEYLESVVGDFDKATEQFKKMVDAWYGGDVAGLNEMFNGEFRDKYPDLYKTLVVQRNQSWVPKIEELLNGNGTSFVAVGAGHLVGPDGVPALLEKAGYKVERQ